MRLPATFLLICGALAANPEPAPRGAESPAEAPSVPAVPTAEPVVTAPAAPAAEVPSSPAPAAAAHPTPSEEVPMPAEAPAATKSQPPARKEEALEVPSTTQAASAEGTTLLDHKDLNHVQVGHQAKAEEIASLLRIGHTKQEKGDYATAEMSYLQVLAEHATPEQNREAIIGLARTYRKKGDFTKAGASYERFIKEYPNDGELPLVFLELGRTLRALGAHQQAITRFYSVLNMTLKIPTQGPDQYRQLVRTAQYEIADTYFQIGDYAQANRYFSRLKLLDLAPEDRARAHFKSALALALSGEDDKAVLSLRTFLDQNPDDENIAEAQYLLSVSLRRLGRSQESLHTTLGLLKVESSRTEKDPVRWQYWQRKTGNQLANDFYERGEIEGALQIYTSLAQLSTEQAWTLSATYQMGLCYERLRHFDRARECYSSIVSKTQDAKNQGKLRADVADLAEMATWRLGQLDWQLTTEKQISAIFAPAVPHLPASPAPLTSDPLSAVDHDVHGSAPIASHTVR